MFCRDWGCVEIHTFSWVKFCLENFVCVNFLTFFCTTLRFGTKNCCEIQARVIALATDSLWNIISQVQFKDCNCSIIIIVFKLFLWCEDNTIAYCCIDTGHKTFIKRIPSFNTVGWYPNLNNEQFYFISYINFMLVSAVFRWGFSMRRKKCATQAIGDIQGFHPSKSVEIIWKIIQVVRWHSCVCPTCVVKRVKFHMDMTVCKPVKRGSTQRESLATQKLDNLECFPKLA